MSAEIGGKGCAQDTIARLKASLSETEQSLKEATEEGKSLTDQHQALLIKMSQAKQEIQVISPVQKNYCDSTKNACEL